MRRTQLLLVTGLAFGSACIASCSGDQTADGTLLHPWGPDGGAGRDSAAEACAPTSCAQLGAECGTIPNGCGGSLECGSCTNGSVCGGAGANKCGKDPCTSRSCAQVGASCGFVSDGCSQAIDCGSCPTGQSCLPSNQCHIDPIPDGGTSPDADGGALSDALHEAATLTNVLCAPRASGGEQQWKLLGSAVWADERLALTPGPATVDNFGSAWCTREVDLQLDLMLDLEMYFGTNDVPGSDGIWAVLVPADSAADAGFQNIYHLIPPPSLAVEFDTFDNQWDPPNYVVDGWKVSSDHVGIVANGSYDHRALGLPWKDVGNLEDGIPRRVRIQWTASSHTLAVSMRKPSDNWSTVLTYQQDLVAKYLGGNHRTFYGFTSKCGPNGDHNYQYVVP